MDIIVIVAQFVLSLSILILLHEMGHFFPAKWFNTRVEKFYLFFDPWFSLFKIKKGDTEYGIGWLPLGGYVKISGMIDESMDTDQMKGPAQPWEFRSKPAWQRLIIMLGGVTVNFILGFLIFGMMLWVYGEKYLPVENVKYGIVADSLGMQLGLQNGDKILKVGTKDFVRFNPAIVMKDIVLNNAKTITVERNGQTKDLSVPDGMIGELSGPKAKNTVLFIPRRPFDLVNVAKDSPAEKAGLQKTDKIIAINGSPVEYYDQFESVLKGKKSAPVDLTIIRNGKDTSNIQLVTTSEAKIGIEVKGPDQYFKFERQNYTFFQALPAGVSKGLNFLGDQIKAFGQMFKNNIKASDSLGGFASIAKLFPTTWDWEQFWNITAILSLILGFMNLLPIPALDGGHVMFLLWEVITGKKVSDKFMEKATTVGFVLLLALIVYANGLDIFRAFK